MSAATQMLEKPIAEVLPPPLELIHDDGEPLESNWHRLQMNLLINSIRQLMAERGRSDYFAGGNMFVYFSAQQVHTVATQPPAGYAHYRGPDVFFVGEVEPRPTRESWVVWEEGGRYPDVIVELLSPSTAEIDRTVKKRLYEQTFQTPEYYLYDRAADDLEGHHLYHGVYRLVHPGPRGWLRSHQLDAWLGRWEGWHKGEEGVWLRLYDDDGRLIPTAEETAEAERERAEAERERAEAERERAEAERERAETEHERAEAECERADTAEQRAKAAEAEVARLRAQLARQTDD